MTQVTLPSPEKLLDTVARLRDQARGNYVLNPYQVASAKPTKDGLQVAVAEWDADDQWVGGMAFVFRGTALAEVHTTIGHGDVPVLRQPTLFDLTFAVLVMDQIGTKLDATASLGI